MNCINYKSSNSLLFMKVVKYGRVIWCGLMQSNTNLITILLLSTITHFFNPFMWSACRTSPWVWCCNRNNNVLEWVHEQKYVICLAARITDLGTCVLQHWNWKSTSSWYTRTQEQIKVHTEWNFSCIKKSPSEFQLGSACAINLRKTQKINLFE